MLYARSFKQGNYQGVRLGIARAIPKKMVNDKLTKAGQEGTLETRSIIRKNITKKESDCNNNSIATLGQGINLYFVF